MKLKDIALVIVIAVALALAAYVGGMRGQASYDRAHAQWERTVIEHKH